MLTPDLELRLREWRKAEDAAVEAERAVANIRQAAGDPPHGEIIATAKMKRERAEQLYQEFVRAVDTAEVYR